MWMRQPFSVFLVLVAVGSAGTSRFTIGRYLADAARSGATLHASVLKKEGFPSIPNGISRFQRSSSLFRLRLLRHVTTAALLLTMCSPVLVLKQSQQPSIQFTTSFYCGPVLLFGLNKICSPTAAIGMVCLGCVEQRWLPTWNVVNVHAAWRTSHFKTELLRATTVENCRPV